MGCFDEEVSEAEGFHPSGSGSESAVSSEENIAEVLGAADVWPEKEGEAPHAFAEDFL